MTKKEYYDQLWDEYDQLVHLIQHLPEGSPQWEDAEARCLHLADELGINSPDAA